MTGPRIDLDALYAEYRRQQGGAPAPDLETLYAQYRAQPAPTTSWGEHLRDGVLRTGLGQGVAMGFGDELEGAWDALRDAGAGENYLDAYRRRRDEARAKVAGYARHNPGAALAAEVVGGVVGGVALPVGGAARAASGLAKIGRAAREGATYGAIGGFGHAEGSPLAQAGQTVGGAVAGGVLGGAGQAVANGVGAVARRLGESAEESALRQVATDMTRSNERMEWAPGMTFADVLGTPAQRRLDYALMTGGDAATEGAEYLAARGAGRAGRLQHDVEAALNVERGNVVTDAVAREAARSQAARVNYGAAYAERVPVEVFRDLPDVNVGGVNPFRRSYEVGRGLAAIDGVNLPAWDLIEDALTAPGGAGPIGHVPVQALDYMKRGMDKIIARGGEMEHAIDRTAARALRNRLAEVLDAADPHAPAYAHARRQWADAMEIEDAAEWGSEALRATPERVAREIPQFGDAAQPVARQHLAQRVYERYTGNDRSDLGTTSLRGIATPMTAGVLAEAAPTSRLALALRRRLAEEQRMLGTEATALRNSATARRLAMARETEQGGGSEMLEAGRASVSALTGNIGPALQMAARHGGAAIANTRTVQRADALARLLLAGRGGPAEIDEVVRLVQQYDELRRLPTVSRALAGRVGGRLAAPAGASAVRGLLPAPR